MKFDYKKIIDFFAGFIKALTQFLTTLGLENKNRGAIDGFMDDIQNMVNNAE